MMYILTFLKNYIDMGKISKAGKKKAKQQHQ